MTVLRSCILALTILFLPLRECSQAGESHLRNCGLGYTIVRPGPLLEEPGGGSALVFDQGNRITQVRGTGSHR